MHMKKTFDIWIQVEIDDKTESDSSLLGYVYMELSRGLIASNDTLKNTMTIEEVTVLPGSPGDGVWTRENMKTWQASIDAPDLLDIPKFVPKEMMLQGNVWGFKGGVN
jgi:hypothetical protein